MTATILKPAPACAVLAALLLSGCADRPLSSQAAALPVFTAEQPHPAVIQAMGVVKADLCLWPQNETSAVDEALAALRRRAEAEGATALIDYQFQFQVRASVQRPAQCRRYIEAEAVAVMLDAGRDQAAAARPARG